MLDSSGGRRRFSFGGGDGGGVRGKSQLFGGPESRGLHSSTFQLNLSAFHVIGGAFRGYLEGAKGVLGGSRGCLGVILVLVTAQVELRSGHV